MEGSGSIASLQDFFETVSIDSRIGCSHMCVYLALVYYSVVRGDNNELLVYRSEVMLLAKVSRRNYNKCMRDLVAFGYLTYEPSANSLVGSKVYLKRL